MSRFSIQHKKKQAVLARTRNNKYNLDTLDPGNREPLFTFQERKIQRKIRGIFFVCFFFHCCFVFTRRWGRNWTLSRNKQKLKHIQNNQYSDVSEHSPNISAWCSTWLLYIVLVSYTISIYFCINKGRKCITEWSFNLINWLSFTFFIF